MGEKKEQVTPLSLGVEVRGGVMSILIPRNSPIPTKVEGVFVTPIDNQITCAIRVGMGERARSIDNILLKAFTLSEFPPTPKGLTRIKVCFQISTDGILTVSAQIVSNKDYKAITFTKVSSACDNIWPSKDKIEEMIQTANECKSEDLKHKEKALALNDLLDYIYEIEKSLKKKNKEIVPSEKERLEIAIKKAKSAETKEEIQWMKKELNTIWDSIINKKKRQVHSLVRVIQSFF